VREGDDEVVEVVFELGDDHARRGRAEADPAAVGVGGQVELGHRFQT
jgi:hypothetical protein